jgi:hypothetical protein
MGRKRKSPRDESVQTVHFPSAEIPRAAENLEQDAADKERVKKAASIIPEIFTPDDVIWVFDVYVGILCFIYSLTLKCEFKVLQDELDFTPEQKELMAKPLAKICSKHAPAEWAGMTAEIQLIAQLGIWTVASFQRARNVVKAEEEKKKDAERTRPVQSVQEIRRETREHHVPA